jgi:hypothetical protein
MARDKCVRGKIIYTIAIKPIFREALVEIRQRSASNG